MIGKWYRKLKVWIWNDPIFFHPYFAFHYKGTTYVKARAIQDYPVASKASDRPLKSFFKMVLRLLTDEVKGYTLQLKSKDHLQTIVTDHEGYFFTSIDEQYSNHITLTGKDAITKNVPVMLINPHARSVIVSDIDDTILMTGVRSKFKWRLIYNSFFKNPWKRKEFDQSSQVYQSLVAHSEKGHDPIIYLSNSPWNIFDYITTYLEEQNFPKGIVMLRDIGRQNLKKKTLEQSNKYIQLERLLQIFKDLNFVLIGDSGEKDFAIYTSLARHYPNRVAGIFIRNIGSSVISEIERYNEMDGEMSVSIFSEMEEIKSLITKIDELKNL